jgi:CheY-like chemotaxis protein
MAKELLQAIGRWKMSNAPNGQQACVAAHEAPLAAGLAEGMNPWADSSESAPAGSETILLVEDELFVREVAGKVLRSAGYQVLTARAAPEAIRICDQCSWNVALLLSDIVLPGQSGHELANALKHRCPSLRVLLMTGYSMKYTEVEADSSERVCLKKPFSAQMLLRKVRQVLDAGRRDGQHASR